VTADQELQEDIAFPRGILREVTPLSLWGGDTLIYRTIVALAAVAIPVMAVVHWTLRGTLPWPQLAFAACLLAGALTCLELSRRGQRELAGALLVGLLWLATTIYAFKTGYGMHSAVVFVYLPCMLYTALFFGIGIASAELVLTVVAVGVMYAAEVNGRLDGAMGMVATGSGFNYFVGVVVTLVATLVVGVTYHRRVEREAARVVAEAGKHLAAMRAAQQAQTQLETAQARLASLGAEMAVRAASRDREVARAQRDLGLLRTALARDLPPATGALACGLAELAQSGLRPLHRETLDISALAQKAAAQARLHPGYARVTIRIDAALRASGDRQMIESLLCRLVERACGACRGELEPVVDIGSASLEGQAMFFVRDNGPALDAAQRARLFEPFGQGAGLPDLTAVYARCVAERHGGELEVESVPGKKTTFFFSLPG